MSNVIPIHTACRYCGTLVSDASVACVDCANGDEFTRSLRGLKALLCVEPGCSNQAVWDSRCAAHGAEVTRVTQPLAEGVIRRRTR